MRERMIHFFQMMRGDEGKENAKDGNERRGLKAALVTYNRVHTCMLHAWYGA